MKKILSILVLCLMLSVLFTACRSNMFIKRHYNDGYYIAKAERPRSPGINSEQHKARPHNYSAKKQSVQTERMEFVPAKTDPYTVVASNDQNVNKRASYKNNRISHVNKMKAYSIKMPTSQKMVVKKPAPVADGDGLSLFWIVILAILILWAIAFIAGGFGLGDVIHVLLIIALVLLILWLLRIL